MAIKDLTEIKKHLFICNGSSCKRLGAEEATGVLRSAIKKAGLHQEIHTSKTLCNGRCDDAPVVIAMPEGKWFKNITPESAEIFVKEYLVEEKPLSHLTLYTYGNNEINS
ncbi:(2Fe-2S) ferredoxin [Pedobacter sp. UYP24]